MSIPTDQQLEQSLANARKTVTVEVDGEFYTYHYNAAGYEIDNDDPGGVARDVARREWERVRRAEVAR